MVTERHNKVLKEEAIKRLDSIINNAHETIQNDKDCFIFASKFIKDNYGLSSYKGVEIKYM